MKQNKRIKRGPVLAAVTVFMVFGVLGSAYAALLGNDAAKNGQVIIGLDDDNTGNGTIQPVPSPPGPDQSLSKSDQIFGGLGPDTLIGRLGPDVFKAGAGDDVIVGGTEGGQPAPPLPNSDIAYGEAGSDTFIWSPGDGSDAFVGGNPAPVQKVKKVKKKVEEGRRAAPRREGQGQEGQEEEGQEARARGRHAGDRQPDPHLGLVDAAAVLDPVRAAAPGVQLGQRRPDAARRNPAAQPQPRPGSARSSQRPRGWASTTWSASSGLRATSP